jgi:hypothetical protein
MQNNARNSSTCSSANDRFLRNPFKNGTLHQKLLWNDNTKKRSPITSWASSLPPDKISDIHHSTALKVSLETVLSTVQET